jgi:hypothetical protein
MDKDIVVVESKTVNNESVPITINVAEVMQGEEIDKREISRSFIFEDFKCKIPLKLARILIKENPGEYHIVDAIDEDPSFETARAVKTAQESADGFPCPAEGCDVISTTKAGRTSHARFKHPAEFEKLYAKKPKVTETPKE